jgi:hypothetical protein
MQDVFSPRLPWKTFSVHATFSLALAIAILIVGGAHSLNGQINEQINVAHKVEIHTAIFDTSPPLTSMHYVETPYKRPPHHPAPGTKKSAQTAAVPTISAAGAAVEQTAQGTRPALALLDSFDGLGFGFTGPQGTMQSRNPSDNSLAVGPDHIIQIVNSRMAIYTKKSKRFAATGKVLLGPIVTNTLFAGFGGQCEKQISGDAVVRYDQLAHRWLFVLPIFRRPPGEPNAPYSMCYAVSVSADPMGKYYRYEFKRPLFPDYPRPAIWPDGYYIPTSTGDTVIQKHACLRPSSASSSTAAIF